MSDQQDSRLSVMEQEVRRMHETIRVLVDEIKALTRSVIQSDQQHLQHQQAVDANRKELDECAKRLALLEREYDQQRGALSMIRWFFATFATVAVSAIAWLLSVVLSTQSTVNVQQTKQVAVESRLQTLEHRGVK